MLQVISEGVAEEADRPNGGQLPAIPGLNQIDSSEGSFRSIFTLGIRLPTASSFQETVKEAKHHSAEIANLIYQQPPHAQSFQEKRVYIGSSCFLILFRCCTCIDGYAAPSVHSSTSDQSCHRMLWRKHLELYAVHPTKTFFKESSRPTDAFTLPCPRQSEQSRT
jgi:hypothetical protein